MNIAFVQPEVDEFIDILAKLKIDYMREWALKLSVPELLNKAIQQAKD